MSEDELRLDDAEPSRPEDVFAPEKVDEAIAARLEDERAPADREAGLVAALAGAYALPEGAEASLARVRARIREASAVHPDAAWWLDEHDVGDVREAEAGTPVVLPGPQTRVPARTSRLTAGLRAIAAVLLVALLGGSFFALLHGRPGAASASVWVDASITHAHLAGPLDFAPALGLTYAVAETGGTIYACDANHLWYSADGGRSYAPFPLAYPTSDTSQADELCNMDTAPGAPGIFVVTYGQQTRIEYAAIGDSGWRTLRIPDTLSDNATGERAAPLDASDIAQAVSSDLDHHRLQVVGNWVFVLAQAPNTRLVATPDFGTTWYQLDVELQAQKLKCDGFTVSPDNPHRIFCGADPVSGTPPGASIWQTFDGGKQWEPLRLPGEPRITGFQAGGTYLYVTLDGTPGVSNPGVSNLWRYPLAGGAWQQVTTLPNWSVGGGTSAAPGPSWEQDYVVAPDDTVYEWLAAPDGGIVTTRVYMLAPGDTTFTEVGSQSSVTFSGQAPVLELGGIGAGGSPALYLHDRPTSQNDTSQPMYRLALPATRAPVQSDTTPLPQPAPTATATQVPPAACTTATGNVADIQPGGFGATVDTFDTRWGGNTGVGLGHIYFKQHVVAMDPASNGRVYYMMYSPDAGQKLTIAQMQELVASILPTDVTQTAGPRTTPNGIEVDYCSAALIAAFPASVQMSIAPLYRDGRIAVVYSVDSGGYVAGILFEQHVL